MMDNNFFDYSLAMERIKSVTGCKTQQDLAKFLGVSQSCISDAKKRMAIPAEWLLKLLTLSMYSSSISITHSVLVIVYR